MRARWMGVGGGRPGGGRGGAGRHGDDAGGIMSKPEKPSSSSISETSAWEPGGPEGAERDLTGRTLGDFQVERMLGRGGMGEVYLARQISLNRPVALKVL